MCMIHIHTRIHTHRHMRIHILTSMLCIAIGMLCWGDVLERTVMGMVMVMVMMNDDGDDGRYDEDKRF